MWGRDDDGRVQRRWDKCKCGEGMMVGGFIGGGTSVSVGKG